MCGLIGLDVVWYQTLCGHVTWYVWCVMLMVWSCYLVCMVCYVDGMVMLLACGTGVLC